MCATMAQIAANQQGAIQAECKLFWSRIKQGRMPPHRHARQSFNLNLAPRRRERLKSGRPNNLTIIGIGHNHSAGFGLIGFGFQRCAVETLSLIHI